VQLPDGSLPARLEQPSQAVYSLVTAGGACRLRLAKPARVSRVTGCDCSV